MALLVQTANDDIADKTLLYIETKDADILNMKICGQRCFWPLLLNQKIKICGLPKFIFWKAMEAKRINDRPK